MAMLKYILSCIVIIALVACNKGQEPDPYINIPIEKEIPPAYRTIDIENIDPELKNEIFKYTKGGITVNNVDELPEYTLFPIPQEFREIDYTKYTLLISHTTLAYDAENYRYNFYRDNLSDSYVFNTSFVIGADSRLPDNIMNISRNAIVVNKLPTDKKVTYSYGLYSSGVWD